MEFYVSMPDDSGCHGCASVFQALYSQVYGRVAEQHLEGFGITKKSPDTILSRENSRQKN